MLAGLAEFRDADPTFGCGGEPGGDADAARVVPIGGDIERLAPPGAASMFFDDGFRGERGGVRGGDVARDASRAARPFGHGRAPALSDASSSPSPPRTTRGACGREVRRGESGAPAEILRVQRRRGVETRRRDGDDRIVNVDSKNSRAFRAKFVRDGRVGSVPRASGAIPARGSSGRANARMETEMSTSLSSSPLSTSPAAFPVPADRRDALGETRGRGG